MTIAKVPDWMELKPEMMRHLIREHEKLGRTFTEEETVTLLRSVGFESFRGSDDELKDNCYYHALSKPYSSQDFSDLSSGRSSLGITHPSGTY
jgi:hypothetical protein